MKKFIIRDPKTRVIRKSKFRDRIVHHALVNILEQLYEKCFIYDRYANRKKKGTIAALHRFDKFKQRVTKNGKLCKSATQNNMVRGYILKADIKQFFDSVNHLVLLSLLRKKIKDTQIMWLVNTILKNFDGKEKGMPLGNITSQFFANVYLNELDYFIKQKLKMKYYVRYVDDFIIMHQSKEVLENCLLAIKTFLKKLKIELHQDKSKIFSLYRGVNLLGFRVFYHHRLLRKRNVVNFQRKLSILKEQKNRQPLTSEKVKESIKGWIAYAKWADTHKLRKRLMHEFHLS